MLFKKISLVICFIAIFSFSILSNEVSASSSNVTDWLNEEEEGENSPTEQEGNNQEEQVEQGQVEESGSMLFELIKMFFALVLVLALIYVLLKFLNKRNKLFTKVRALESLGGVSVGQNKSVQIVRLGDRFYLLGVGDNVELLQEITDENVKADLIRQDEAQQQGTGGILADLFHSKGKSTTSTMKSDGPDFKDLFSGELKKLKNNRNKLIQQQKQKEDRHE
ncbi:flagella biosynthesis protein FliZ [Oceanobacillus picturae]|uniref:Flagella biosynthesis protein FliZ n=1 Tax=Oceanobacillus picturae TaxID=171693 RepID=A0A0U9HAG8_9BACI|nr:flagellar biosynthetic protein FliO [Oceanobacillus picturae]GAQ16108.1 flagella biosynthesis protein FliZ [Oceanobacillus picturae]